MARLRREKIMAQMSEMQKHFINENKELFQQSLEELEASTSAAAAATDNGYDRWTHVGPGVGGWLFLLDVSTCCVAVKEFVWLLYGPSPPVPPLQSPPVCLRCVSVQGVWAGQTVVSW